MLKDVSQLKEDLNENKANISDLNICVEFTPVSGNNLQGYVALLLYYLFQNKT